MSSEIESPCPSSVGMSNKACQKWAKNVKNTVNELISSLSIFHFIEIKTQKYYARKIAFVGCSNE